MKADVKELRIGNYLQLGESFLIVSEINNDYFYATEEEGNDFKSKVWDIQPIELTEEWLIKMGFTNFGKRWTHSKLPLDIIQGVRFYMNYVTLEITYVHTLQNLFFSLCGEELTIKN